MLGDASFSPGLGLTEKDVLSSKKLKEEEDDKKKENGNIQTKLLQHEIKQQVSYCNKKFFFFKLAVSKQIWAIQTLILEIDAVFETKQWIQTTDNLDLSQNAM